MPSYALLVLDTYIIEIKIVLGILESLSKTL